MLNYQYCGLNINSNISIPELPLLNHKKTGVLFRLEKARQKLLGLSWSCHWQNPNGDVVLSYGKKDSYHWLHFPKLANFRISKNAKEIICYSLNRTPQNTVRHLLLDQVLPRCLAHQGKLIIHASAIQVEGGILIFVGSSGSGKSTLVGYFHQYGQPIVSDDAVWIKYNRDSQIVAIPSYTGLRLWEDSLQILYPSADKIQPMAHYSDKKRVQLGSNLTPKSRKSYPVVAVIVLTRSSNPSIREVCLEPLHRRDAFIEVLKETFQLNSFDLKERTLRLQALGQVISGVSAFRLTMTHEYEVLATARQKILRTIFGP